LTVSTTAGASRSGSAPTAADGTAARGGKIERAGGGGAPVHQERFEVGGLLDDAEPADVAAFAVPEIQPAETQPVFRRIEPGEPLGARRGGRVTFRPRLMGAAVAAQHPRQPGGGALPQRIEPVVQHGDVPLLGADFFG